MVEVVIDTGGNVVEATMLQSVEPPWPEGDAALLTAIEQWKYEPSELDGMLSKTLGEPSLITLLRRRLATDGGGPR